MNPFLAGYGVHLGRASSAGNSRADPATIQVAGRAGGSVRPKLEALLGGPQQVHLPDGAPSKSTGGEDLV